MAIDDDKDIVKQDGEYVYEAVINTIGYGKFSVFLFLFCCLAAMADAIEILSLSMVMSTAVCDLNLTTFIKGWIDASVFIGMFFGGLIWGPIGDITGRRTALLASLMVNWVFALTSSFVFGYREFLALRILSGCGIGGSVPVIFSYFAEFQQKSHRGTMLSVLTLLWMSGNVVESGLAWIILPDQVGFTTSVIDYRGWRLFICLCAVPSFVSFIAFIFMPESPKYLLQQGKEDEAIQILQKIYKMNNGKELFEIKKLIIGDTEKDQLINNTTDTIPNKSSNVCLFSRFFSTIKAIFRKLASLFNRHYALKTILLSIISSTFSFGYYGMFMWFPELFSRSENSVGSVCSYKQTTNVTDSSIIDDPDCSGPPNIVYIQTFIIMTASLVGSILPIILLDKIGRNILLRVMLTIFGSSIFFLWLARSTNSILIISCVFTFCSTAIWCILDILPLEMYPTELRSTAMGAILAFVRLFATLANVTFGTLMDSNCSVIILLTSGLALIGGLASLKLTDMTKKDIN
ncbi:synaptic vesicle glycoprotein 2C [Patella vulgata]|uniref:synaptic vesicle glycoprotein 2C n=1 Tax=Patella vulgata TaxID=6465 RepID=UPI00217F8126|nr:synaptic vesicle glycoprotein 2C [Patella vulgata]